MKNAFTLDGVVIGSARPDELKDWYRKTFDVAENENGAFVFGSVRLFVFPHDRVSGTAQDPARILLGFSVDDAKAVQSDLKAKGVRFIRDVEEEPFGLIGTIVDLDGNYLQIIQLAPVAAG
jgi:predicted enzyme related to lactoylglutathione lyase